MRVCDITNSEDVAAAAVITIYRDDDDPSGEREVLTFDVGTSALKLLQAGDFYNLGQLVPRNRRPGKGTPGRKPKPKPTPAEQDASVAAIVRAVAAEQDVTEAPVPDGHSNERIMASQGSDPF